MSPTITAMKSAANGWVAYTAKTATIAAYATLTRRIAKVRMSRLPPGHPPRSMSAMRHPLGT